MVTSYYLYMISANNRTYKTATAPATSFDIVGYYSNIRDIAPRSSGKSLCRVCLREGSIPIHGDRDIAEALTAIAHIKISEGKDYPKHLCEVCHKFLKGAIMFRKRAKLTNKILKKSISVSNPTTTIKEENIVTVKIERIENDNDHDASETHNEENGSTKNESTLLEHEFDIRAKPSRNKNRIMCKLCNKSFCRRYYSEHLTLHNPDHVNQHVCNICGRSFRMKNTLVSHVYLVHRTTDEYSSKLARNKKMTCSICNKSVNMRYLKKHMTLHNPSHINEHVCELCGKSFRQISNLQAHHHKYHNNKISLSTQITDQTHEFICEQCGKSFRSKGNLLAHIQRRHQPRKPETLSSFKFECEHCPYRAKERRRLRDHMVIHSGVKDHECTECPAKFYYKSNLTKHMLSHKERRIQCDACNRMFHTETLMRRHYEVEHLGILKHVCHICGKAFGLKNKLRQHQRLVHKVERCDYKVKPLYLRVQENQNRSPELASQM